MRGLSRPVLDMALARSPHWIPPASFTLDRHLSFSWSDIQGNEEPRSVRNSKTDPLDPFQDSKLKKYFDGDLQQPPSPILPYIENSFFSETNLSKLFGTVAHRGHTKHEIIKRFIAKQQNQKFDNGGIWRLFRQLSNNLDLDRAVLLCNNLPLKQREIGYNTLINCFMERAEHDNTDLKDQDKYAGKILELLEQMKVQGFSPPKQTHKRIMKWLSSKGNVIRFQEFMEWMKEDDQELSSEFECYEAELWLKAGKIGKAKNLYVGTEDDHDKHMRLWNAKIQAFSSNDRVKELLELLKQGDISQTSCKSTLTSIFQCLGRFGKQTASREYLLLLKNKGTTSETLVGLITSYAEGLATRYKDSKQLLKDIKAFKDINSLLNLKPADSFNVLIAHCCNHGEIVVGIDLIKTMKESGIEISGMTYEPLLVFYAKTLDLPKAEYVLAAMRRNDMHATPRAYEALIQAYAVSDNMEKAYNVIEEMPMLGLMKTASMYTPIIRAYGIKGKFRKAYDVLRSMDGAGLKPNAENFATLIHACASRKDSKEATIAFQLFKKTCKQGSEDSRSVIAALLKVYGTCGNSEEARQIISNKKYTSLVGTIQVKSAFLMGLARSGQVEEALKVFNDIREMRMWPESLSFLHLLNAIGNTGDLDQLLQLFELFRISIQTRSQIQQEEQISAACVTVVNSFVRHNELGRAVEILQQVQKENIGDVGILCSQVFQDDTRYCTVEESTIQLSLEDKFKFVKVMDEKLNLRPTRVALEALLESCAKEKDVHRAQCVVEMMKREKLQLNIFTFLILLRTLVSAGDDIEAKATAMEIKRAMENNGLEDKHVKMIVSQILSSRSRNGKRDHRVSPHARQLASELFELLYASRS